MDAQLLVLVLLLMKEKLVWWRITAAAFLGGAGAVLVLVSGMGFGFLYMSCILALDACMLLACAYRKAWRREAFSCMAGRIARGIIYLHGMVFAYGKLMGCAARLMGTLPARITAMAVTAGIAVFLAACRTFADRRHIYDVVLTENGEEIAARALFDTGNLLCDPLSGKPVSVMEDTGEIRKWMEKYPQKYRIIPYQSIGNSHGIMEGIVVDELMIQKEGEQVVKRGTIVALYEGRLSKNGDFRMILNHRLISV